MASVPITEAENVILTRFPSLTAPKIVKMAASDENFYSSKWHSRFSDEGTLKYMCKMVP